MIWLREWGIWNELDEETGKVTLPGLRATGGETRPRTEASGHIFFGAEFADARAFWTLPMIFGWDTIF
jgi:hypothetical protein